MREQKSREILSHICHAGPRPVCNVATTSLCNARSQSIYVSRKTRLEGAGINNYMVLMVYCRTTITVPEDDPVFEADLFQNDFTLFRFTLGRGCENIEPK